jgi:hypothetical protein
MSSIMLSVAIFLLCGGLVRTLANTAEPALRVIKSAPSGTPLLRNGNFEEIQAGNLPGWQASPQGFAIAPHEGRGGSQALACENHSNEGWFGAGQTLVLNRTNTAPLLVRGWSKAQHVSGSADSGYALYADLVYTDDTPLWGRTGNFRCGTHDWELREFVILPEKPVKTVTLYCLFRGHTGKVWFDDLEVAEVKAEDGAVLYQGVPVLVSQITHPKSQISPRTYATGDALKLILEDNTITSLQINQQELSSKSPSGFLARDVASNSDFIGFENGACPSLGLNIQAQCLPSSNHLAIQGRLTNTTGRDRAMTLLFALPVDAAGWNWGDDIRRQRSIQGQGEFANQVAVQCGATGALSLYPLAPIWNDRGGLAIALDMAKPAQYRLGYHAGARQLFIAYDFGLVKDTARFPNSADFRFVIYSFDSRWGFRAALQKYQEIFPDDFVVRSKDQGLWMPFTDVSTVQDWQDFGFRYHEGNNNVPWDDAHGILSFRYTEPMTWWMPMKKDLPRTLAEALRVREELAAGSNPQHRQMAQVSITAAMFDEVGEPGVLFRNEPWCNGAVWSLNPNPWLSAPAQADSSLPLNAATAHWNEAIKQQLYGPAAKGQLDGEYLDSLEGYVTAELNFRRDHFRETTVPLTFSTGTHHPALFKGLAVYEFTRWIAEDAHRLGKLMFANGVPYRFTFLCPWLDVLGTETDWLRNGKYQPVPDATLALWRAMSGSKPYLLLMNTDYEQFTPSLVEKYFQRALFYGMWPSMFSHNAADNPYWQNPKWYNRDRHLFKKYLPIIKPVAEAGWHPVTDAVCDNPKIDVERFGPDARGRFFFTLYNNTSTPQTGRLTSLNRAKLGLINTPTATNLVSGQLLPMDNQGWKVELEPQQVAVIQLSK